MLKRQIILLLVLALLLPQALAAQGNLIPYAQSHLTEVYGYTQAQADAFVFEDDGAGSLRGWEREHPQWVYTFQYGMQTREIRGAKSPFFHPEFVIYPGEGGIRDILNLAGEQGWFQNWNPASLQAFAEALQRYNSAQPSIELLAGLSIGDISASQAVEGLFSAFVGPKGARPPAADAWLKEVLDQQGLQPDGPYLLPLGEAVTLENPYIRSVVYTRFTTPVPAGLQGVFSHPKLAGWACIEGITMERSLTSEFGVDIGFAAFEKEGARLLIMLVREKGKEWALYPVGENALRRGLNMTIRPKAGMMNGFQIIYDIAPGQREVFEVNIGGDSREGRYACRLEKYERSDASKGYVFTAQSTPQGWDLLEIRGEDRQSLHVDGRMFAYMEAITDIENFPHNLQAWSQMPGSLLPPGYAMLNGVRLREKATTKSPSLGMFHPGTLLQIIDQEEERPGSMDASAGFLAMPAETMQLPRRTQTAIPSPGRSPCLLPGRSRISICVPLSTFMVMERLLPQEPKCMC